MQAVMPFWHESMADSLSTCVCVCEREREGECECVSVCVCARARACVVCGRQAAAPRPLPPLARRRIGPAHGSSKAVEAGGPGRAGPCGPAKMRTTEIGLSTHDAIY